MNILITGGNGQLGRDCKSVFQKNHVTTCVDIEDLDITNADRVSAFVREINPDVLINCAAFTQVDACETQRELAQKVNVTGPENLAKSARANNTLLVHISTDYVFDGKKQPGQTYKEKDIPSPVSYYGVTKASGERSVINNAKDFMILRTAWLYGFYGNNFIKTIVKKALAQPEVTMKIVNDQIGCPTWTYRLALQIEHLISHETRGLFHASSEGFCSWYEFAKYFLEKLHIDHHIAPCATEEYPLPAVRPQCSILENRRLTDNGLNVMRHWQADLDAYLEQYGDRLIRISHDENQQ